MIERIDTREKPPTRESIRLVSIAVVLIGVGVGALGAYIQKDQAEVDRINRQTATISRQITLNNEEKGQLLAQIPPKNNSLELGRIGAFSLGMGLMFAAAAAAQSSQEG